MKRGKPTWQSKAGPKLMARVQDALRSLRGNSTEIWQRHNLSKFCALSTFRQWANAARRGLAAQSESSPVAPSSDPQSLAEQLREVAQYAMDRLHANAVPDYAIGPLLQAVARARSVELAEDANKRAQQLHEQKIRRLKAELQARAKANPKQRYSPAEITRLIDDVMSGKLG